MHEYNDLEHMNLVRDSSNQPEWNGYYLPHYEVIRESNIITKFRVVFNESQCIRAGESF